LPSADKIGAGNAPPPPGTPHKGPRAGLFNLRAGRRLPAKGPVQELRRFRVRGPANDNPMPWAERMARGFALLGLIIGAGLILNALLT